MKLIIPCDADFNALWRKYTKEQWESLKKTLDGLAPKEIPYRDPDRFPCYAKEICTSRNPNGADEVIYDFLYDFEEVLENG